MSNPTFRPFSIRHREAIFKKDITISLSKRLRRRIWYLLEEYEDPECYDILGEMSNRLLKTYGVEVLEGLKDNVRQEVHLKDFVLGAYPAQVFDVVEFFFDELWNKDKQKNFPREINTIMPDEGCPWLLCDGYFFKMDNEFLEKEVLGRAMELLASNGFKGALDEFKEARKDFTSQDYKGTVHNACKALESVMQTITENNEGNASELIRQLPETGIYQDIPEKHHSGLGNQVLMGLPFLRNKLGGHGQGKEVVETSKGIAKLALNLSAGYIVFLIEQYLEFVKTPEEQVEANYPEYDDVPF